MRAAPFLKVDLFLRSFCVFLHLQAIAELDDLTQAKLLSDRILPSR